MDRDGNIENKDQFSREEVSAIISRVRHKALIKINEILDKQVEVAKEASYDAMLDDNDNKKIIAKQLIHGITILEGTDESVRDSVSRDIEDYLTD